MIHLGVFSLCHKRLILSLGKGHDQKLVCKHQTGILRLKAFDEFSEYTASKSLKLGINCRDGWALCASVQMPAQEEEQQEVEENDNIDEDEADNVESESMVFLEWSSVCKQVSDFASSPLAIEIAREGNLPIGKSRHDSQELLDQTAAAYLLPAPLDLSGIMDVRHILRSTSAGVMCSVKELCTVQTFLSSVHRVSEQLEWMASQPLIGENGEAHDALFPLQSIMASGDLCSSLNHELKVSVDSSSLTILDSASPTLAAIRAAREENTRLLETLLKNIGQEIAEAGGMDSVIVTTRRARLCVAVWASHKHLVPRGVVLDLSNSGATVFMEPKAAIELNNKEVQLTSQEKAEEIAILENLTHKLVEVAEDVWVLMQKVTHVDLACARASHAKWLQAVKPSYDCNEVGDDFRVYIEGLSHPLLLGSALNSMGAGMPVPVDFMVKSNVNVVIVSGPNTGGKTAALKTLGVAALMAKAGLFLPAKGKAVLPWFDKVLADIGDNQSLEQSLSTFSGHIKRVCRIMQAGGNRSLVLFDELGSGTDPSEGSALASSILEHMAGHVCLTVVTTHFANLSGIKKKDSRFEVASVEFDAKTLCPRFRILWGVVGHSNALDIANSLGIDKDIIARAQHWMKRLTPENYDASSVQLMDPLIKQRETLQSQAALASLALSDAKKLYDEVSAEADGLEDRVNALRLKQEDDVKMEIAEGKARMDRVVSIFERSRNSTKGTNSMSMREALAAIADINETYSKKFGDLSKDQSSVGDTETPAVGDLVLIKRLGKNPATVIEDSAGDGNLIVQAGILKVRVKPSEIIKIVRKKESASCQRPKAMAAAVSDETSESTFSPAVQTSRNTVDLRGSRVDAALFQLELAIMQAKKMSVFFVVHGEGTGVLKAAVLKRLREHPSVVKFKQENSMNYGCTVVYVK